ncbi:DNA cytosine methyltransferase [Sphingobacterium sp. JUb56]|uniref:DNA cytosine methyltransferase n=1 Tax=Sphingobacterium sp. JUb56 TaxID=2587145 RepID=UPI00161CB150|nr:DNA (cytosine-5-)-methyltransferase [Sphingobacterium sp. JUb56]MBB2951575.1 DNA (cytosine-5)-methyltransferase 1 [Sphingobacterium sp. JUb56]
MPIPIVDLFAGPGGLGEGFSSVLDEDNNRVFQIKLSIEKDQYAHQTLRLRSFCRQFADDQYPQEYYDFVQGIISLDDLYNAYPVEYQCADDEAWCVTLGVPDESDSNGVSNERIDERISDALNNERNWVLIGGPPCQAYSLVGRSRRQETILDETKDKRVGLYKEYLRIIAVHKPAIFVMENVKGLLSAKTEDNSIFSNILSDLQDPTKPFVDEIEIDRVRYHIYSLSSLPNEYDLITGEPYFKPQDFLIKSENYGVPQKRHRVILLGIRDDINVIPNILERSPLETVRNVINNLPKLRSGLTREYLDFEWILDERGNRKKKRIYNRLTDNFNIWKDKLLSFDKQLRDMFDSNYSLCESDLASSLGKDYVATDEFDLNDNHILKDWYYDRKLNGILHHESRKHLLQDIYRYYFAATFTMKRGTFPKMMDYKSAGNGLLPDHENAESGKFNDRFRVQLPDDAATTVTSHISKDGHYFIHYDPSQARSLTVREAARIQTFPDNYYFFGGRTNQYHQVGNAVPPYLAFQIGKIVKAVFDQIV